MDMQAEAGPSNSSSLSTPFKADTPCRYFYRSGSCRRGDKCQFSHELQRQLGQPSSSSSLSPRQSTSTRLSAQASTFTPTSVSSKRLSARASEFQPSSQGRMDDYENEDEWQDELPEPLPTTLPEKQKSILKGVLASVTKSSEPCSICMEIPTVYAHHSNCDHSFCPPCLTRWRRQRGLAKSKHCPMCRAPSKFTFVAPQPFTSTASRLLALQRFRERAASTPCKNFTKSLALSNKRTKPFCPFGDDCLYQHEINGQPHKFGTGRYRFDRSKKGTKRLVRPLARSHQSIGAEFFDRIRDMDERVRMFLSTRVILSARSNVTVI